VVVQGEDLGGHLDAARVTLATIQVNDDFHHPSSRCPAWTSFDFSRLTRHTTASRVACQMVPPGALTPQRPRARVESAFHAAAQSSPRSATGPLAVRSTRCVMAGTASRFYPDGTTPDFIWLDGHLVPWGEATVHVTAMGAAAHVSVFEGIRAYAGRDGAGL